MTSARPVLIHVGMPRTATTSLQLNLFSRHPEACYIGKPLTRTRPEVARVTRGITYDVSLRSASDLTAFQKHCIAPLLAEHSGPVVISEEEFATSTPTSMVSPQEIAERIHTLFPTAAILVTIRRQDHMIPSLFGHMVRMGMLDLEDWTPFMRAVQETPQLAAVADYAAVVARYEDLFGAHKVHVQAYEQLTEDPASYVKEICRLARIDPAEGLRQFTAGPVRNARPTNTNKAVPDTWRAWTTERYGPGNLQLANKFGLTLERWGYAV